MKKTFITVFMSAVVAVSAFAQFGPPVDRGPKSLKDAYEDYFTIGVAVNKKNITDPSQIDLIK